MHEEWTDLIPYYVNRTLSDGERAAFERHLASCDACRHAVDDWNLVAGTVYQEVDQWVQQAPPLSAQVRARLHVSVSPNGHGLYPAPFRPDETVAVYTSPRPNRRFRLPLTLVAAAAVVLMMGILALVIASRGDDATTPLSEPDLTETLDRTPLHTLGAVTATPLPTQPRTSVPTQVADLGIMPPLKTPTPKPSITATRLLPTPTPRSLNTPTPSLYWPVTPTAAYTYGIGSGYIMILTAQIGPLPVGTRVRISHAWYDGTGWIYAVVGPDENTVVEAREGQLAFAPDVTPGPTPTAAFQGAIGMGYLLITTVQMSDFPAGTRVRISHAWHNGYDWNYAIVPYNTETVLYAQEWQLGYAPDVTPGPTPTAAYGEVIGAGYVLRTTGPVGAIPAGARVRIASGRFDGFGWLYDIVAEDGTTAQARTSQLMVSPDPPPTYTPPPTLPPSPTFTPVCPYPSPLTSGCPSTQRTVQVAFQPFENGTMIWRADTRVIYVLYDRGGVFEWYPDTWVEGEPVNISETPPTGRATPTRGFGKLWAATPAVRTALGWALEVETGYTTVWETYPNGDIYFRLPDGTVTHLNERTGWAFE